MIMQFFLVTEQVAFDPFAISLFLYSMSIFEGKTHETAQHEVHPKSIQIVELKTK